jgi:hypothetical protein
VSLIEIFDKYGLSGLMLLILAGCFYLQHLNFKSRVDLKKEMWRQGVFKEDRRDENKSSLDPFRHRREDD